MSGSSGNASDGGRTSDAPAASGTAGVAGGHEDGGSSRAGSVAGGGTGGGTAGAGMSCPAPLLTGDHSRFEATEQLDTYAVSGTTEQELRLSINAHRGHEYDALTTWHIGWSFEDCASPVWHLALDITYSMPDWEAPADANTELVSSWQSYMDALYCHEYGHGKIALDCANEIFEGLSVLGGSNDCDAIKAAATAEAERVIEGCNAREVAYDAETEHGATMGATFPPNR
jgi:predicted secreted Zn-dependent protease